MSKGINIGADGPATSSVTIENPDELKTQKVGGNGQVYISEALAGEEVLIAYRVESKDEQENDESDAKTNNN